MVLFKNVIVVTTFLFLTACASGLKSVEFPADTDANAEITRLEEDLQAARSGRTDVASPKYFKMADQRLAESKKMRDKGKSQKAILETIGEGRAAYNEARRIQETTQDQFADVTVARESALAAGAQEFHPRMLKRVDADFTQATEQFEKEAHGGKTGVSFSRFSQSQRDGLKQKYADLELESLKSKHLGRAAVMIENAEKNRALAYAPKTLESAKIKYKDAETVITQNRKDTSAIEAAVTAANLEAEKLVRVTNTARAAKGLSSEDIALDIENKKEAISEAEMTAEQREKMIKEKNEQLAGVMSENQEYRRQVEFDAAMEKAQKMFSPEEADVYRQGDKILIRLKSANFVSGRADVGQNAYPVLGKVKDLISEVGAQDIAVEGHTDTTGSKEINAKLSKERADAVAAYLTNNTDIKPWQITTEGFGFEKPLAPNNTKQGRAQNRRVDIIVTPSQVR